MCLQCFYGSDKFVKAKSNRFKIETPSDNQFLISEEHRPKIKQKTDQMVLFDWWYKAEVCQ